MSQHHELSPSKFPAWAECPWFEPDTTERPDAVEGTAQHAALAASLNGDEDPEAQLTVEAREAVHWATNYVKVLANGGRLFTEHRVHYIAPDRFDPKGVSQVYYGTADVVILHGNYADVIDYKSGANTLDHRPQLAGYALALFSMRARLKTIRCHILYGRIREADTWTLSQAEAAAIVLPILYAHGNPSHPAVVCDYCFLCRKRAKCPALVAQVETVARAIGEDGLESKLAKPETFEDPEIVSKAMTLSKFVSIWAKAVRENATRLAQSGVDVPGYRLQKRCGRQSVTELYEAYNKSGLTLEQFFTACNLSLGKLAEAYAETFGLSKSQANEKIQDGLSGLVQQSPDSYSLVKKK